VPWILRGLLLAAKSKRGRELLLAGALAAVELAQSDQARKLYAKAGEAARDPRARELAAEAVRKAAQRVKR